MSIAADNFAVPANDAAIETPGASTPRLSKGKFLLAFAVTILAGSGLRAVADAGLTQAIDNYYAKQLAVFSEPVPELVAAIQAGEAADAAAATAQ